MKCNRSYLCLILFLASSTVAGLCQSATGRVAYTSPQQGKPTSTLVPLGPDQWVEITGQDGDFKAAFPVKPKYMFEAHPEPGLTQNNHIFLAQHNGHTLMVSYMDIILSPGDKYDEVKQRKHREMEIIKIKGKEGWKLLSSTNLPSNGYQHIYFVPPTKPNDLPAYFRGITFVHGTRVYLITYDALIRSELFGPEAKRFFNSFKFTEANWN